METIKESTNVEFEVIYDDGERCRVHEGVLFGVDEKGDMILHNGTDEPVVWLAAAEILLEALWESNALKLLAKGMLNHVPGPCAAASVFAAAVRSVTSHDEPAIFRLGQMDMRESAADMLEDLSKEIADSIVSAAFLQAAALVRDVKI